MSVIQQALASWSASCNVNLVFAGETEQVPQKTQDPTTGLTIRWAATAAYAIGHGSPTAGVILDHMLTESEDVLPLLLTHEIGHTIGLLHIHEDPKSIMSYKRQTRGAEGFVLAETDKVSCNMAIQKRYGVPYTPPAGTKPVKATFD